MIARDSELERLQACTRMVKKDAPAPPPRETPRESDRLLRPQPPRPIPPRHQPTPTPGLVAYPLMGHRVFKC